MLSLKGNKKIGQDEINEKLIQLQLLFKKNLKIFKIYYPEIYKYINTHKVSDNYKLFYTDCDELDLICEKNDSRLFGIDSPKKYCKIQLMKDILGRHFSQAYLASEEDVYGQIHHRYIQEARNMANKQEYTNCDFNKIGTAVPVCVVFGSGLGYTISEIVSKLEVYNLIILEPDFEIFYYSLFTIDWTKLIEKQNKDKNKLTIIIDNEIVGIKNKFFDYIVREGWFLIGFIFKTCPIINKKTEELFIEFDSWLQEFQLKIGYFDDAVFATSQAYNNLLSDNVFLRNDIFLPDEYRNIPVFVIGNGPSLDDNISFLRKYQDNAIILACGTALDSLYHSGIKPDFYTVTERTPDVAESIEIIPDKDFLSDIILISSNVIHPTVTKFFKKCILLSKFDEAYHNLFSEKISNYDKIMGISFMNPLVGNSGTVIPVLLNFYKIYLFGLDCGYKNNFEHSTMSALYNKYGAKINNNDIYINQGNFGGEVKSNLYQNLSIKVIENMINVYNKIKTFVIYNCSDGAYIKGTIPTSASDINFNNNILNIKYRCLDFISKNMTVSLKLNEDYFNCVFNNESFIAYVDVIIKMWGTSPLSHKEFVERMHLTSVYLKFDKDVSLNFYGEILNGTIQRFFLLFLYVLFCTKNKVEGLRNANNLIKFFKYFLEDAKIIAGHMPYYILERHKTISNNKVGQDHPGSYAYSFPEHNLISQSTWKDDLLIFQKKY